jgi:hypothetical protein
LLAAATADPKPAPAQSAVTEPGQGSCDPAAPQAGVSVGAALLAGQWTDQASGAQVEIAPDRPAGTTRFRMTGRHAWEGTFAEGRLTLRRQPAASEMDHLAPQWAREAVQGKLEWRLELEPRLICGRVVLRGRWYPGLIRFREAQGSGAEATPSQASVAGDGRPIDITYARMEPSIGGVVVLSYLPQRGAGGLATFPYPYPEPPNRRTADAGPLAEELNPFAFSPYSQEYEIYQPAQLKRYSRAPNGRLYVAGERVLLYVYGKGLPRAWDRDHAIEVQGGDGAQGLSYAAVAVDSEKPEMMGPIYRDLFQRGRDVLAARERDPAAQAALLRAPAMLVQVALGPGVLPGYKDFTINGIRGNSQWLLRFADDRALVSFGRELYFGESDIADRKSELVTALFVPERSFLEVKTEVALPLDEIPLRLALNGRMVRWNGASALVAKRYPGDPTRRTYRTAIIALYEAGKPPPAAEPGVIMLPVRPKDRLVARLDDEGLLSAESRPGIVHADPRELGLTWPQALARAARADRTVLNILVAGLLDMAAELRAPGSATAGVATRGSALWDRFKQLVADVAIQLAGTSEEAQAEIEAETDWNRLSGHQAAELDNLMLVDLLARTDLGMWVMRQTFEKLLGLHGNQDVVRRMPVTLGEHAALLLMRDELVRQMKAALDPTLPDGLMAISTDDTGLLALRAKLQPDAWSPQSAWSYIRVPCPGDEDKWVKNAVIPSGMADCSFSFVLDDDYIQQTFHTRSGGLTAMIADQPEAVRARKWVLAAMKVAVETYQHQSKDALTRAEGVADGDIRGLVQLLAADCPAEVADLPCGYKALRPFVLPRMMRQSDPDPVTGMRLWRADLDARYRLRTLNSFIAAVKNQKEASSADTDMAVVYLTPFLIELLPEDGILGVLRMLMEAPFFGTIQTILMNGILDYPKMAAEKRFALGASLVLGTERLAEAQVKETEFYTNLLNSLLGSMLQDAWGVNGTVGKLRAAAINSELAALRAQAGAAAQVRILEVLRSLPLDDQRAFWRTVLEAKILQESGSGKAMSQFHRDIADAADAIIAEMGLARPEPPPAGVTAVGDPLPIFDEVRLSPEPARAGADEELHDIAVPEREATEKYAPGERPGVAPPPDTARTAALGRQPDPVAGGTFSGLWNGQIAEFRLGAQIGEKSAYAAVFLLDTVRVPGCGGTCEIPIPGCEAGCVIKIYRTTDAEAVVDIIRGSRAIGDIPQPELMRPEATAQSTRPYLIQRQLHEGPNLRIFKWRDTADFHAAFAAFNADPGLGDALLELAGKLAARGLGFPDINLPNLFFERVDGRWVAGILDTDFIAPHAERRGRLAKFFANAEIEAVLGSVDEGEGGTVRWPANASCRATRAAGEAAFYDRWIAFQRATRPHELLYRKGFARMSPAEQEAIRALYGREKWDFLESHNDPIFPDAYYSMEKMLEKKGYIRYDPAARQWIGVFIDPGLPLDPVKWERYFPKMFDPEHLAPLDLSKPFAKTGLLTPPLDATGTGRVIAPAAFHPPVLAQAEAGPWRIAA